MGLWKRLRGFLRIHIVPLLGDRPWSEPFMFHDAFIVTALAAAAAVTRFHTFWQPHQRAFGEAEWQTPLSRLIFSAFDSAARSDEDGERLLVHRWAAIMAASMVPPVWYLCVRIASFSRLAAVTAASLVLFDTSMLCVERLGLPDALAHLLVAVASATSMHWFSLRRNTLEWRLWMAVSGIAIAVAAAVKTSAALLLGLPIFHETVCVTLERKITMKYARRLLTRMFQLLWPPLVAYLIISRLAESLLREPDQAAITALYTAPWIANPPQQWNISQAITSLKCATVERYKPSPVMSHPLNWPFMTDIAAPLFTATNQHVLIIGNWIVYLLSVFGVAMVTITLHRRLYFRAIKFVVAYLVTYIPFLMSARTFSQRDYCIPLMFGAACYGIMLDFWLSPTIRGSVCVVTVAVAAFGYFEWSPLVYARDITPHEHLSRLWFSTWATGRASRAAWLDARNKSYARVHPCL